MIDAETRAYEAWAETRFGAYKLLTGLKVDPETLGALERAAFLAGYKTGRQDEERLWKRLPKLKRRVAG